MLKHLILHGDGEKETSGHRSSCGSRKTPFSYTSPCYSSDIHGGVNSGLPSGFQDSFSWPSAGVGMIRGQ